MTTLQELIAANMPAPGMLQEYLEATGEELPETYKGSSTNIHLAELFVELLENDNLWVYNRLEPVPTIVLSDEEYLGMMVRRFSLSAKERMLLSGRKQMIEEKIDAWVESGFYSKYDIYLYLTLVSYIYKTSCSMGNDKKPTFAGIWQVWEQTFYPEILIPPYLVRNVLEMFEVAFDKQAMRDFPEGTLPNSADSFDDAIYVAFQMSLNHMIDFWAAGVSCKGIRILLDGGVESREALELGQTMPLEWIEALEKEPRKWWHDRYEF